MENFEMRRPILPTDTGFIFVTPKDNRLIAYKHDFPNWPALQSAKLTDTVNQALIGPDSDKVLQEFDSIRENNAVSALEFLEDVAVAKTFGLDTDFSVEYARGLSSLREVYSDPNNLDPDVEAPKLEELLKNYDEAYVLGIRLGLNKDDTKDFATSVTVDNNSYIAGKIVAEKMGLGTRDAETFANVYGGAIRNNGMQDGTVYSLAHLYSAKAASQMNVNINRKNLDAHANAALKLIRGNPSLSMDLSALAHNAIFAGSEGLSKNPDESFDFAIESLYVKRNGLDLNRWTHAVLELKKQDLSLDGAMDLATELEEVSDKSNVYPLDRTLNYLDLQKGTGIAEDKVVENVKIVYKGSNS